jgi:hypothetical protein
VTTALPPEDPGEESAGKRPISEKKLAAICANAQKSTGAKTQQGKEARKFNAAKYGLTARYFPNLLQQGTPEWEDYQDLRKSLYQYHEPISPIETILVEKIAVETLLVCQHRRFVFF